MRDVQPRIDEFVADVQPRLDTLLKKLQEKIDEIRREMNARAARRRPDGTSLGELPPPGSGTEGPGEPGTMP